MAGAQRGWPANGSSCAGVKIRTPVVGRRRPSAGARTSSPTGWSSGRTAASPRSRARRRRGPPPPGFPGRLGGEHVDLGVVAGHAPSLASLHVCRLGPAWARCPPATPGSPSRARRASVAPGVRAALRSGWRRRSGGESRAGRARRTPGGPPPGPAPGSGSAPTRRPRGSTRTSPAGMPAACSRASQASAAPAEDAARSPRSARRGARRGRCWCGTVGSSGVQPHHRRERPPQPLASRPPPGSAWSPWRTARRARSPGGARPTGPAPRRRSSTGCPGRRARRRRRRAATCAPRGPRRCGSARAARPATP